MRGLEYLYPPFKAKVEQLVEMCKERGLNIGLGETFRTVEEQNNMYAQGRTKPGSIITNAKGTDYNSQHQWGIAFDFFKNVKGSKFNDTLFFEQVGALAKSIGLGWGGDWTSIKDRPHFYLTKWGDTPTKLINKYGSFANFKKTWTGTVKCNTYLRKTKIFNKQVILTIPKGKKVNILWKSKLGYAKVEYNGKYGYIKTKNLK